MQWNPYIHTTSNDSRPSKWMHWVVRWMIFEYAWVCKSITLRFSQIQSTAILTVDLFVCFIAIHICGCCTNARECIALSLLLVVAQKFTTTCINNVRQWDLSSAQYTGVWECSYLYIHRYNIFLLQYCKISLNVAAWRCCRFIISIFCFNVLFFCCFCIGMTRRELKEFQAILLFCFEKSF